VVILASHSYESIYESVFVFHGKLAINFFHNVLFVCEVLKLKCINP
jgi:hypothetical protein